MSSWCVYILITEDGRFTYCGASIDFAHRFRQHCGHIKGGARLTNNLVKAGHTWRPLVVITGFCNQTEALQMELCQKKRMASFRNSQMTKTLKSILSTVTDYKHQRIKTLAQSLLIPCWTPKASISDRKLLKIYWYKDTDIPEFWEQMIPEHLKPYCQLPWVNSNFVIPSPILDLD